MQSRFLLANFIITVFAFCLSGSDFASAMGPGSGLAFWQKFAPANAPPTALSITHTPNRKSFSVSWTAGMGNGGAGGCKLQYYANGSTWTDLAGTYDCDAAASAVAASLPSSDYWTNDFNGTGVQIRIAKSSDSTSLAVFGTRLTCSAIAASTMPTSNIDENCNHQWDDTYASTTMTTNSSLNFGAAYSCPSSQMYYDSNISTTVTANFTNVLFAFVSGKTKIYWNVTNCTAYAFNSTGSHNYAFSTSGSVPSTDSQGTSIATTACQIEGGLGVNYGVAYSVWDYSNCNYESPTTYYR